MRLTFLPILQVPNNAPATERARLFSPQYSLNCSQALIQARQFCRAEAFKISGKESYPTLAARVQQRAPFLRRLNQNSTAVFRIRMALRQPGFFQCVDNPAHRGWTHLFGRGEGVQRHGTAKHQH